MLYNGLKMSEYEVDWLTDFLLTNSWVYAKKDLSFEVVYTSYKKNHATNKKTKKKSVIFQSIGIIVLKDKETRVVSYTCRYSSKHLIPII